MPHIMSAGTWGERMIRPVLALLFFVLAMATSQGQEVTIDRVDVVESGIYKIRKVDRVQAPNTASGVVTPATDRELLRSTTTVPAKLGTSFGVRFNVIGKPRGTKTKITFITTYPAQGLRNPDTGKTAYRSEFEWEIEIGKRDGRTYTFDNAWEVVPGEWALEFWYQGRKLGGQTFTVAAP
jgi:Domain of unknown function (DUF3859)